MIKKCKVLSRNAINMVVMFDSLEVQMPSDGTIDKEVYVKKIGNSFAISSIEDYIRQSKKKQSKTSVAELASVHEKDTTGKEINE